VPEVISESLRDRLGLVPLREALLRIHQPRDVNDVYRARNRLAFEELFLMQVCTPAKNVT